MPTIANRPPRHDLRVIGDRIGENSADNEFVSSAVVANADGSLLERVEYVQTQNAGTVVPTGLPGSYNPMFGYKVTKSATIASAPDALFDVTGLCEITRMIGITTSVIATSTSMSINSSTNDMVISASTQITTASSGTVYVVTGDLGLGFNAGGAKSVDGAVMDVGTICPFYINDDQIEMNVNTAGTGLITWHLWYWPMAASAAIVAAA